MKWLLEWEDFQNTTMPASMMPGKWKQKLVLVVIIHDSYNWLASDTETAVFFSSRHYIQCPILNSFK